MKLKLYILTLLLSNLLYSQIKKDSLFKKDISFLVEEMEFMYGYDQLLREYTVYKTFNIAVTDSIEKLDSDEIVAFKNKRKFASDSLQSKIWKNYINPKDEQHTKRMIQIIKKYGFPSNLRIRKYYKEKFENPEFTALLLLVHSPKLYWEELKNIMKKEFDQKNIDQCNYGFFLWHISGRKSWQPLLDNGYIIVEENGKSILKSTCK